MKFYKISQSQSNSDTELILPSGTTLYHATVEEFDYNKPKGGGYDQVFWTTESKEIAKTYIPESGGVHYLQTSTIAHPNTDPGIINLQRILGIEYDESSFGFDNVLPGQVTSYKSAQCLSKKFFGMMIGRNVNM